MSGESTSVRSGMFVLPALERVAFGRPAAEVVLPEAERLGARRVFLLVSGTMNRSTDEVAKLREALGHSYAGTFDVSAFIGELGLPRRLAEVGVTREHFRSIAEHSMNDEWVHVNPRKIDSVDQVLKILNAAA